LFWPEHPLTAQSAIPPHLPRVDIKRKAVGMPYRHRLPGYLRSPKALMHRLTWSAWLASHSLIPTPPAEAMTKGHPVRHLHIKGYE
jgi:hypothetical protein